MKNADVVWTMCPNFTATSGILLSFVLYHFLNRQLSKLYGSNILYLYFLFRIPNPLLTHRPWGLNKGTSACN